MNCAVCGERGSIGMGGVILCTAHAEDVRVEMDRLRAEGKGVNVPGIARRMYRELHGGSAIIYEKDFPKDLKLKATQRALNDTRKTGHKVTFRDVLIEALEKHLEGK